MPVSLIRIIYGPKLAFKYQGFDWYIGSGGANCDDTCNMAGMKNAASQASSVIQEGDCTLILHFRPIISSMQYRDNSSKTSHWTFGYYYNEISSVASNYFCTNYGSQKIGTRSGETNRDPGRQIICACSK